jgi:16S rRNA (cytosine1402-N4)-methyltransferase
MSAYHVPVLLPESVTYLGVADRPSAVYVDATFGGGGHSRAILNALGPEGRLIAFDLDPDAQANVPTDARFTLVPRNYADLESVLDDLGIVQLTGGILADLGVSSHQLDQAERGFSYRADAALDLRMGPSVGPSASELLNQYTADELAEVFRSYGELPQAGRLARTVLAVHRVTPIHTTGQLVAALEPQFPRADRNARLAQAFQALRIAVNDELAGLERLLTGATRRLATGARLVVISYHSLEDRRAKHMLSTGNLAGQMGTDFYGNSLSPYRLLTRKVVVASQREQDLNPRSRSARLRAAERNQQPLAS